MWSSVIARHPCEKLSTPSRGSSSIYIFSSLHFSPPSRFSSTYGSTYGSVIPLVSIFRLFETASRSSIIKINYPHKLLFTLCRVEDRYDFNRSCNINFSIPSPLKFHPISTNHPEKRNQNKFYLINADDEPCLSTRPSNSNKFSSRHNPPFSSTKLFSLHPPPLFRSRPSSPFHCLTSPSSKA